MHRNILALLCAFIFCLSSVPARAAEEISAFASETIPAGEHLRYSITWLGIPVGYGELQVIERTKLNRRDVYYVKGIIRTNKVLRTLFPVDDTAESWIDAETLESLQFEKKIDELLTNTHERLIFDAPNKTGHYESFKTGEKKEFSVTVPVHDVLSAFYWTRRQELIWGKIPKITLTADQKDWLLSIHFIKKETIKLHGKKVKTLRVEPVTVSEGVTRKGKAWFNITADRTRIPVRIVYKAPIGNIVGTLERPDK